MILEKEVKLAKSHHNDKQEGAAADKTILHAIIDAINNEDSKSIERLWLSASDEVRNAFIRNKNRLETEFEFKVTELPLMGEVLGNLDIKNVPNTVF